MLLSFIGKSGLTPKQATDFINAFKNALADELAAGTAVSLPGVGKFRVIDKAERQGRNPSTGETLTIKAHRTVKFQPALALKAKVN